MLFGRFSSVDKFILLTKINHFLLNVTVKKKPYLNVTLFKRDLKSKKLSTGGPRF